MNFFQKIGNSLARFMYGRNGVDQLGFVTLWAAIILDVVNLFVRNQVAYSILSAVAMVLTIWMVFRMFSKNLSKRRAENAAYMNKVVYPLRQALSAARDQGAQVFHLPQLPHGVPGTPGQGPHRHHLPQVRRGNPRQKLTARKYQLPARGTRAGSFFALPLIRSTPPGRPPAASHRRLLCSRHRRRARPHSRR